MKSTGDGIMAVFTTGAAAIRAAYQATTAEDRPSLVVRSAIHTGAVTPVGTTIADR